MHDHDHHHHCRQRKFWSRRDFLFQSGGGIAGIALADLLHRQGLLAAAQSDTCEAPIPGADRDSLADGLRQHGHRSVAAFDGPEDLAAAVASVARDGDIVVCMGAGTISLWANELPRQLAAIVPARRLREVGP